MRDDPAHQSRLEMHALALDVGAGIEPELKRPRIAAELDADLFQDGVDRRLDARQAFFAEQLESRNLSVDAGDDGLRSSTATLRLPRLPPAPTTARRRRLRGGFQLGHV